MSNVPYWIHCNICSNLLRSQKCDIYLLSCNHMLCKECMHQTERGTKCPLCKQSIKYIDIKKLPKEQQYRFEPQAWKRFRERMKIVNFQKTNESNLARLTYEFKLKAKKAAKINQELKSRVEEKKATVKKMTERRMLMQSRLKEVFLRNQKKNPSQRYRDAKNFITPSNSVSPKSNMSSVTSGFFSGENGTSHRSTQNIRSQKFQTDFFGTSSSTMSSFKGSNTNKTLMFGSTPANRERSQSTRTPFYY